MQILVKGAIIFCKILYACKYQFLKLANKLKIQRMQKFICQISCIKYYICKQ